MKSDKAISNSVGSSRQKIIAVGVVLLVIFLLWEIYGMMSGSSEPFSSTTHSQLAANSQPKMETPKTVSIVSQTAADTSVADAMMLQQQQDLERKYIAAVNELQMLKVSKDIADANKDIAKSKLEMVMAQKVVVEQLEPTAIQPGSYAAALNNPGATQQIGAPVSGKKMPTQAASDDESSPYTVISVSQLQNKWGAVLGYQGTLIHVYIGDSLPLEHAQVVAIDNDGIEIEKDGKRKKIALVSLI
jgi:hypothetical protein